MAYSRGGQRLLKIGKPPVLLEGVRGRSASPAAGPAPSPASHPTDTRRATSRPPRRTAPWSCRWMAATRRPTTTCSFREQRPQERCFEDFRDQCGDFDDAAKEYVITRPDTPRSWTNHLGSTRFGGVITNNAGGYAFFNSAYVGRLLRF